MEEAELRKSIDKLTKENLILEEERDQALLELDRWRSWYSQMAPGEGIATW